jgi:ATP-dependent Clp protease adaptor protein ClpS
LINIIEGIKMTLMATETKQTTRESVAIKQPNMYKVVFNNDDTTPMNFVIELLKAVFHHNDERAHNLTIEIHEHGKGVAGVYTFEIAEQKHNEALYITRSNGHNLNINLESE